MDVCESVCSDKLKVQENFLGVLVDFEVHKPQLPATVKLEPDDEPRLITRLDEMTRSTMTAPNVPTPFPVPHSQIVGRSLLIVDDEPVIRMIARTALVAAGFIVAEAGDEVKALEAVQKAEKPFDLILLDLTLGATNGAELIPVFRQHNPATRILVVSGLGAEDAEGLGADGFLSKPFNKTSLLIAVWQTLASLPAPTPRNEG